MDKSREETIDVGPSKGPDEDRGNIADTMLKREQPAGGARSGGTGADEDGDAARDRTR
jgi:hypothetical protein